MRSASSSAAWRILDDRVAGDIKDRLDGERRAKHDELQKSVQNWASDPSAPPMARVLDDPDQPARRVFFVVASPRNQVKKCRGGSCRCWEDPTPSRLSMAAAVTSWPGPSPGKTIHSRLESGSTESGGIYWAAVWLPLPATSDAIPPFAS